MNPEITISCQHAWREISNYMEGEIDADLRARIDGHLRQCAHCTAIYDGTRNVLKLVADGQVLEVPEDLSTRIYSRLKQVID